MYAIVDIETTGGYAAANDITEVAIILHDGTQVTGRYETLVKPSRTIPYFIQSLTGINHQTVADAPPFAEVAETIHQHLQDRIFVAHNVNFDYSFLKHHLSQYGFELATPKLCTVRLARKVFPSLPSYSLGNLCRHFNIGITARHRAGGDATATAELFSLIVQQGAELVRQSLKRNSREQSLPPNLPKSQIDALPYCPGVYYFHDQKGKIIYVGKARNIKYRVTSHFSHNGAGRQRQEFLRNIHSITYRDCGNELMAFILENIEIRRYWPKYNTSQKSFLPAYGLYMYEDCSGNYRLILEKQKTNLKAFYTFNTLNEGQRLLNQLGERFDLSVMDEGYNQRVMAAIGFLKDLLPTFAVVDDCFKAGHKSCILIENGRFFGMGYLPEDAVVFSLDNLKDYLQPYPENDYIRGLIYQYVQKRPEKKIIFSPEGIHAAL